MSDNYPPGSDTADAPWNQAECPECEGEGIIEVDDYTDENTCPECEGTGILMRIKEND